MGEGTGRRRHAVLGLCGALAVTAGTAGVRAAARESSPLTAAAAAGRGLAVTLELDTVPVALPGAGAQVLGHATLTEPDRRDDVGAPPRTGPPLRPVGRLARPSAGETVTSPGRASPPRAGDDVLAVLSIRGPPRLVGGPGAVQRVAGTMRGRPRCDGVPGCSSPDRPGSCRGWSSVTREDWIRCSRLTSHVPACPT